MKWFKLNLRLFEGEGSGESAGAAGQQSGEEGPAAEDTAKEAKEKTYTQAEVENIVKARLRGSKDAEARLKSIDPLLNSMASRYGKDAADIDGLIAALDADNSYWENEAYTLGMTVEQAKEYRSLQYDKKRNEQRQKDETAQQQIREIQDRWSRESEELKSIYPDFDFDVELGNEDFAADIRAGKSVRKAYEAAHLEEILGGAMQHAAQVTQERVVRDIQARNAAPLPNGTSSRSTATTHIDPSKLTRAQAEDLERRAARGERITFS